MAVPNTFAGVTTSIPLANLDANFSYYDTAYSISGTTVTYNGTLVLSTLTASTALALNASKQIVSVTNTGSGNNVLATSPTLVTPILGAVTSGDFSTGTFTWPTFNQNTTGTAANVTGVVAVANGGTGLSTTPANGALNIGNGTGFTRATLTAGTGISVTNASGSITIAATNAGTVTSVTGTAPVVSSGGATPAISMAAASTSVSGYLTSTDWNTFNGKQAAGSYVTVGGALGTPSSGTLTNCTFPTLNQNTTGTAANVTGTVAVANGGTGLTTAPANGALDIGNGTGFTRTTLTAGSNISITNAAGAITIAATSGGSGTVTSVAVSGGTTGLTTSGGPITTLGTITLAGTLAVANGGTGVTSSTGSGSVVLGTSPTLTTPTFNSAQVATVSGTAPLYLCRAWVSFTGSTAAIRGSNNVSSITRNGTGNYVVNYTTAMPDANYSAVASCAGQGSTNGSTNCILVNASAGGTNVAPTTTATTLFCFHPGNQVSQDTAYINFAVFR